MICSKCGNKNEDNAKNCVYCGNLLTNMENNSNSNIVGNVETTNIFNNNQQNLQPNINFVGMQNEENNNIHVNLENSAIINDMNVNANSIQNNETYNMDFVDSNSQVSIQNDVNNLNYNQNVEGINDLYSDNVIPTNNQSISVNIVQDDNNNTDFNDGKISTNLISNDAIPKEIKPVMLNDNINNSQNNDDNVVSNDNGSLDKQIEDTINKGSNSSGINIISLVLGIICLVFHLIPGFILKIIGLILSITGLVLGIIYKKKNNKSCAGIIINIIAIIFGVGICILIILNNKVYMSLVNKLEGLFVSSNNEEIIQNNDENKEKDYTTGETKKVGNDELGYVYVPNDWKEVIDLDRPDMFRVASEDEYVVSLYKYPGVDGVSIDDYVVDFIAHLEEKNILNYNENDKIKDYEAVKVIYNENNKWTYVWFFYAEDNCFHLLSVEGSDKESEYFRISESFTLD